MEVTLTDIDIEVQHVGNGDPIVAVQREALIRVNAAICRHMDWDPLTRIIGHREWTSRKPDPRWDGKSNPMPRIRADTLERIGAQHPVTVIRETEEDMPAPEEIARAVWSFPMLTVDGEGVTSQLALSRAHRGVNALLLRPEATIDPAGLADAIVSGMGKELAQKVADEIASRL